MKRDYIYIIVILILLALCFVGYERNNEQDLANDRYKKQVETLKHNITQSQTITDTLKKQVSVVAEKHKANEARSDKPIKKFKDRIEENRPEVMFKVDTMAIVKLFIQDQDSLEAALESKIELLKKDNAEDMAVMNSIVAQQDTTITKQADLIGIITSENERLTDENHKLKKKVKAKGLWGNLKAIGSAVGGFFIGHGVR